MDENVPGDGYGFHSGGLNLRYFESTDTVALIERS